MTFMAHHLLQRNGEGEWVRIARLKLKHDDWLGPPLWLSESSYYPHTIVDWGCNRYEVTKSDLQRLVEKSWALFDATMQDQMIAQLSDMEKYAVEWEEDG